ncbi:SUKH-3 domain-containing protein [Variovorax sp. Root434]|uniref:SUKH-3 domain-containing protein n=1 Tax=Variovorax sp. Root434 TaxID=1736536 RepID=UPI0009E817DC|nr:SUKH-3 domain-containing protein [Variovorax sp. Root434]
MIDLTKISNNALLVLESAGWFSERLISTNSCEAAWRLEKYEIFQEASDFVASFNGMKILHQSYSGGGKDISAFDAIDATRRLDPAWVVDVYGPGAGEKLLPIGQGNSEHLTYFIGEGGGIYGGFDDYFCLIGKSVSEAFENIFFKHQYVQI